jgi:serine/threonine protein kinase
VPDPRIGTVLAGHRIDAVIGRGGASVVYLAEHLALGRKVAFKVLSPHLGDDDAFRERFIRESRIAASLDHPNIVTVFDAGEADDEFYISMRHVDGADLGKVLRAEGALDASRTIMLLSPVASALDAAHAQGLVHRDVKPGNILVARDVGTGLERAYLSDFGLTKRLATSGGLTRTGQFVGTVDYVAPEQIAGEPVDGRTDVYSLGCVLYQCLTGTPPFGGETEVATIYRHLNDVPPRPSLTVELFEPLDGVIAKALAKSKEDRYPTAGGLVEAARVALAGIRDTPTVVRRIVPRAEPERPSGEEPTEEPTLVAAVTGGPPDERDVVPEAREASSGRRRAITSLLVAAGVVAVAVVSVLLLKSTPGDRTERRSGSLSVSPTPAASSDASPEQVRGPDFRWLDVGRPNVFGGSGAQAVLDAARERGRILAVGHSDISGSGDGVVWSSFGGQTWTAKRPAVMGGLGDQRAIAVTVFDGRFVVGGWNDTAAAIWTSPNRGVTWEPATSPDLALAARQRVRDFATLGDRLYAVGAVEDSGDQDAGVWSSADGIRWDRVVSDALTGEGDQQMWAITRVGHALIGVGYSYVNGDYDGAVWEFRAGRWSRVPPETMHLEGDQTMLDVSTGEGGRIVVVGCSATTQRCDTTFQDPSGMVVHGTADAAVWTSEDGRTWNFQDAGDLAGDGSQVMMTVVRYGDWFVGGGFSYTDPQSGFDAALWSSRDGSVWTRTSRLSAFSGELQGGQGQAIRSMVVLHSATASSLLLSFGVSGVAQYGQEENANVWLGFPK